MQQFRLALAGSRPVDRFAVCVHPTVTPHQGGTTQRTSWSLPSVQLRSLFRVRFLAQKLSGFWIVSLVEGVWSFVKGDTGAYLQIHSSLEPPTGD